MISHLIYEKEDLVCIKMVSESYMGGAHGSLNVSYITFDTTTGSFVHLFDRIENKELGLKTKSFFSLWQSRSFAKKET